MNDLLITARRESAMRDVGSAVAFSAEYQLLFSRTFAAARIVRENVRIDHVCLD